MSDFYPRHQQAQRKQMHYSPNLLTTVQNAIDNSLLSTIEYDSREKGITIRDVEPLAVVYKDRRRNLVAFCHLRNEYRAFRLDRLNMIKVTKQAFAHRDDFNIDEFQDDPSMGGGEVFEEED
ncbi:MAG: WYL domain-containing protein [Chitinophagales bacterium]|jgi:predicted DNA-binding transcriptional regulator YafY|nr:WYL domain-containing protein [Chitinophagales bacterium]